MWDHFKDTRGGGCNCSLLFFRSKLVYLVRLGFLHYERNEHDETLALKIGGKVPAELAGHTEYVLLWGSVGRLDKAWKWGQSPDLREGVRAGRGHRTFIHL